jgi:hypothetical protein
VIELTHSNSCNLAPASEASSNEASCRNPSYSYESSDPLLLRQLVARRITINKPVTSNTH